MTARKKFTQGAILLKILLPIAFIVFAVIFTIVVLLLKSDPPQEEVVKVLPRVEVTEVRSEPLVLKVESQGTVQARTETILIPEVSGVVERISPKLLAGSFFKKGDVLLEIERIEYEAAAANARGMLASAKLAYAQEESLSEQAALDWKDMGRGEPSDLVLRKPQLEKAKADMDAARAALAVAERNLSRTTVRAPYDGRVHTKLVDVGQTVNARMTQLARIFSVDVAEVRLPISAKQAGFIDVPERYRDGESGLPRPAVTLSATMGQKTWTWQGVIDRAEGVIDASTRQIFLVAKVDDPYGISDDPSKPPLKVGQFVSAEIEGRSLGIGFIIPRASLKPGDVVHVIDAFDRLQVTPVDVAQAGVEHVYVTTGLQDGDRLCLTQLGIVVDGMDVNVENPDTLGAKR